MIAPHSAQARSTVSPVRFGISDQHTAMFDDPRWADLNLQITRYNVPWNAVADPQARANVIAFVTAASAHGVDVLLHVTGRTTDGFAEPLPSLHNYKVQVGRLIRLMRPLGVNTWGVWNEENHPTEPTSNNPKRAAEYFLAMRQLCTGCQIVAADVLDLGSARSTGPRSYRGWLGKFFAALGPKRKLAKLIGIHNYGDLVASKGPVKARDLIKFVRARDPGAHFWLTESGGLAASQSRSCSEARQTLGVRRMFIQAKELWPAVQRLYQYNWTGDSCDSAFDSGLIRSDGSARPALQIVDQNAPSFSR